MPSRIELAPAAYKLLCRRVLMRDRYKCKVPLCNERCGLHVHHIVFRSKGGPDESWNLITVCNKHHDEIHSYKLRILSLTVGLPINADKRHYQFLRRNS